MDNKEYEISFKGKKTDTSQDSIKQEFDEIISEYNYQSRLIIDFSNSDINQNTVDMVMKDFEYLKNKIFWLSEVQINVTQTLFTNLDFIKYFFSYGNIKQITVDCELDLAINLFKISKHFQIERLNCPPFFMKKFYKYKFLRNHILLESDLQEIREQIYKLEVLIDKSNYSKFIEIFQQCKRVKTLNLEIIALEDVQNDFQQLMKTLSSNMKFLSNLNIKLYFKELIPFINKQSFKSLLILSLNYQIPVNEINLVSVLRKTHQLINQCDNFTIQSCIEYTDSSLKLSLSNKILNEEVQNDLIDFLSNFKHKVLAITILFHNKQTFSKEIWVNLIKLLSLNGELKFIKLNATNISLPIAILSVIKLMQYRKTDIYINGQSFNNNTMSLHLNQLTNLSLQVICDKIFNLTSPTISNLELTAYQIMGQLKPISKYFTKCVQLNHFKLNITSEIEMQEYFKVLLNDVNNIYRWTDQFSFNQQNHLILNLNSMEIKAKVKGMYSENKIYDINLPENLVNDLKELLAPLRKYTSSQEMPFNEYVKRYSIFCLLWKLYDTWRYYVSLPINILAFNNLIALELLNNPYQIYTDLFYD